MATVSEKQMPATTRGEIFHPLWLDTLRHASDQPMAVAALFVPCTNSSHQTWTWYIPLTPSAHSHSPGCMPSKQKGPGPRSGAPSEPPRKCSIVVV